MKNLTSLAITGLIAFWLVVGGGSSVLVSSFGGSLVVAAATSFILTILAFVCRSIGIWAGERELERGALATIKAAFKYPLLSLATSIVMAVAAGAWLTFWGVPVWLAAFVGFLLSLIFYGFIVGGVRYVFAKPENADQANGPGWQR